MQKRLQNKARYPAADNEYEQMYKAGQSTMGSVSIQNMNRFGNEFNQVMKAKDMNGNYCDYLKKKRHSESQ